MACVLLCKWDEPGLGALRVPTVNPALEEDGAHSRASLLSQERGQCGQKGPALAAGGSSGGLVIHTGLAQRVAVGRLSAGAAGATRSPSQEQAGHNRLFLLQLDDCTLQLSHNGTYLDLEATLAEQRDELEGFQDDAGRGKKHSIILRTQLSVRVHACIGE
ncbi:hypothetical protein J1605_017983 [Eschrichtius robustus]|uniref:FHOD1 N-terminal GTPase-binding domain-containing protein n=1 Tax=Eschrichtius robustus TaxID=9764 RepID=A0AB34HZ97_ESCRO|nr:hypothetical protein J1605_017983 [Eschrichtius robustus]